MHSAARLRSIAPHWLAPRSSRERPARSRSEPARRPTRRRDEIAGLDVQRVGREFGIQAIAVDRYRSVVNGPFDVSGSGGGRYPLTLDVTGTLVDSQLFDATFPRMDVTTNLAGGHMRVRTAGMFTGLNPALVTGDTRAEGMLNGSIDAETTIRDYASGVTVDSLDTSGHVELGEVDVWQADY